MRRGATLVQTIRRIRRVKATASTIHSLSIPGCTTGIFYLVKGIGLTITCNRLYFVHIGSVCTNEHLRLEVLRVRGLKSGSVWKRAVWLSKSAKKGLS